MILCELEKSRWVAALDTVEEAVKSNCLQHWIGVDVCRGEDAK